MDNNVGSIDRRARTAIGAVTGAASIAILVGAVPLSTALSPVLGILAAVLLVTAAVGNCPAYSLLGIDSCSRDSAPSR